MLHYYHMNYGVWSLMDDAANVVMYTQNMLALLFICTLTKNVSHTHKYTV